ncbi:MAG: autotransporter domain-containing protein, partial [Planctomycetes bacterium]|nr:autotransporter domain-containing protein [Planctomycetota bacterium]
MSRRSSIRIGVVFFLMLTLAALPWSTSARGATITVSNTNDSGAGSLRQAMLSAGSGDTIDITATGTIALESALPVIDQSLTISGPGAGSLTINAQDTHQVFFVESGTVEIEDMTIVNGLAKGGDGGESAAGGGGGGLGAGGAVFVNTGADVTLDSVDLTGNAAQGGSGGDGEARVGGGGGGGGFHGNGGAG